MTANKSHHQHILKVRSSKIKTTPQKAWKIIGDIASMPRWAPGVNKVNITSKRKRGIGAVRHVIFEDGRIIEEHIVLWDVKKSFTYTATKGLPLCIYIATITIRERANDSIDITWQSYLNSSKMTKKEFKEILYEMEVFYEKSLENLKCMLQT